MLKDRSFLHPQARRRARGCSTLRDGFGRGLKKTQQLAPFTAGAATTAPLPTQTAVFSYDPAGNRLLSFSQTLSTNGSPGATSAVNYQHDANGAMTNDGLRRYEFDAANRLVAMIYTTRTPLRTPIFCGYYPFSHRRIMLFKHPAQLRSRIAAKRTVAHLQWLGQGKRQRIRRWPVNGGTANAQWVGKARHVCESYGLACPVLCSALE
jgi:hypothetical protein